MSDVRPRRVLLADDDESDVILTQEAFKAQQLDVELDVVSDGAQCLDRLRRTNGHEGAPKPDLLLLDINMPKKNGLEVLEEIRADPELRSLPVVMLTTSASDRDVAAAYDRMCSCYIVKPLRFDEFQDVVGQIEAYWFSTVRLP